MPEETKKAPDAQEKAKNTPASDELNEEELNKVSGGDGGHGGGGGGGGGGGEDPDRRGSDNH